MTTKKSKGSNGRLPDPTRLSVGADKGIFTIKLQLGNRKILVREATYLDSFRRGKLIGESLSDEAPDEGTEEAIVENVIVNLWCSLTACSEGDLPSKDEFLAMREKDINFWVQAARELNEDWFGWLNSIEQAESEDQKKE